MPCVGPCCRRCFWPSSAVVCHGGFPSRQTITQNRPVPGLPPWCIRRWFPPDVKSPLVGVPKETSCLGLPSRRFLPCSPAWCDSVAAGSWEVVPLSVLCVCCQPSIELLLRCRDHEQACLSCSSDYMVNLRLSSGGGQRPASCKLSVHHFKQAGPGTEPTPHGPSASAPHWLPVGGSFTAHQRSTSQGTHNNHDSDFRGPAVTVEHRLRYVHDIADVTVSSLKAPGMPRPETTRTGSSLSKAWEGVNRRKSGLGA